MSRATDPGQEWLQELQAYLDGKLSQQDAQALEEKLEQDPKAQAQLDYLRRAQARAKANTTQHLDIRKGLRQYHSTLRMRKVALYLLPIMVLAMSIAYWPEISGSKKDSLPVAEESTENKEEQNNNTPPNQEPISVDEDESSTEIDSNTENSRTEEEQQQEETGSPLAQTKKEQSTKRKPLTKKLSVDSSGSTPREVTKAENKSDYFYSSTDGKRGLVAGHTVLEFIPFYDQPEGKGYVIKGDSVFPVELSIGLEPLYHLEDQTERKRILKRFKGYLAGNGYYQIMGLIADNRGALLDTSRRLTVFYHDAKHLEEPFMEELPYFGRVVNLPLEFAQKGYEFKFLDGKVYILPQKSLTAYAFRLNSKGEQKAEKIRNPLLIKRVKKEGD